MPATTPLPHTAAHLGWLAAQERQLLAFGRRVVREPSGLAYWLGDDGTPDHSQPCHTFITARMAHIYFLATLRGIPGGASLADRLLTGLDTAARDGLHGGWVESRAAAEDASGAESGSDESEPDKQTYTHAFVILAAATGSQAGHPAAARLLDQALQLTVDRFGEQDRPLFADRLSADLATVRPYRGINANMHMVEALLAAADATGEQDWADRASAICDFVIEQAAGNQWRIPEHYASDWKPLLDYNADQPADQFRPYGATVGHAFEWARLLVQAAPAERRDDYLDAAIQLTDHAVADGWARSGQPGFAYTTDWNGDPIVDDRLHWVAAEAIATAATLWQATGDARFGRWYDAWWDYTATYLIDPVHGSWYHQLDPQNQPSNTIWAGKPDLYHAYQAVLISQLPIRRSVAAAVRAS
ncbi:MAG: AGE family epimerase/isomerase [Microlunatus sp.]